jgi:NAD(P)-dependent dehydrogenase (short-subunit alcohol dehydrogenase family)
MTLSGGVVVTGGARGIGRVVCRELADAGARVVVLDVVAPDDGPGQHPSVPITAHGQSATPGPSAPPLAEPSPDRPTQPDRAGHGDGATDDASTELSRAVAFKITQSAYADG